MEQITHDKVAQAKRLVAEGMTTTAACKQIGIGLSTFYYKGKPKKQSTEPTARSLQMKKYYAAQRTRERYKASRATALARPVQTIEVTQASGHICILMGDAQQILQVLSRVSP